MTGFANSTLGSREGAAHLLQVQAGRRLRASLAAAHSNDFKVSDGGAIDPARILESPDLSLYCLDHEHRRALFVEADPEGLAGAPFLYQAQSRLARKVISVPFEVMHELADAVSLGNTRLALVYSTGRCGSTVVSRVLHGLPQVVSLSEPDAFTNLVTFRTEGKVSRDELHALARSCLLLQAAPHLRSAPELIAVKFRSFATSLADVLYEAMPDARVVFMYREAVDYFKSAARVTRSRSQDLLAPAPLMLMGLRSLIPLLDEYARGREEAPTGAEVIACMWASAMQDALRYFDAGGRALTIRYEDMVADIQGTMTSLLSFLRVEARGALNCGLHEDAQAGTSLDRSRLAARTEKLPGHVLETMLSSLAAVAPELSPAMRLALS